MTKSVHSDSGLGTRHSGLAALAVRKGERLHRRFGTIFVVSMIVMAAMAIPLAAILHQMNNLVAGFLTFYFVGTAWMTVRRKEGTIGLFEKVALGMAVTISALFLIWGLQASASPTGRVYGYSPGTFYFVATFSAFAAALDFRVIRRGGISGVPRIARHLWRMCYALFGAVTAFIGQQLKMMPALMHYWPVFLPLVLAPLVVMIFWLIRIRFTSRFKSAAQGS